MPNAITIDELINKLNQIDTTQLDAQRQLINLRKGKDFNFFTIPITVVLLMVGMVVGFGMNQLLLGFIGGALVALLAGYTYHLWDKQWQFAANQQVIDYINQIEGTDGFIVWFKPILAKQHYRRLFYKLHHHKEVIVPDYARAIQRLKQKKGAWLAEQLAIHHPQLQPNQQQETMETKS